MKGRDVSYILLFVQQYRPSAAEAFLKLEAEFKELERSSPELAQGRRYLSEGEPANTLLWECEFASLDDVQDALKKMADDPTHQALFEKQLRYIVETRTEIYKTLDL